MRQVERQVALLRVGASEGSPIGLGTQEQVDAALKHALPSELLLKGALFRTFIDPELSLRCMFLGTVAHEVLQLEMKLEERVNKNAHKPVMDSLL